MISNVCNRILRATLIVSSSVLFLGASANAAAVYGGSTSVALNGATVTALTGLGFSIAPVAPGTLTGTTAMFPITGGDTTTMIDHSGGLSLTKSGVTADITNFVINLTTDKLSGDLMAGANTLHNVTFFDLGSGGVLTLDATLAADLSAAYGIPNLSGATIGVATVAPVLTPEPAALSLVAFGLLGVFAWRKRCLA